MQPHFIVRSKKWTDKSKQASDGTINFLNFYVKRHIYGIDTSPGGYKTMAIKVI